MSRRLRRQRLSPWVELLEIDTGPLDRPRTWHALGVPDYVVVLALFACGDVLLVRQYRPVLDAVTLELPAGMIDPGEAPLDAGSRETFEETGYRARAAHLLAPLAVDGARMLNRVHGVVALMEDDRAGPGEDGIEVGRMGWDRFAAAIRAGEVVNAPQVAVVAQALLDPAVARFLEGCGAAPPWRAMVAA